MQAMIERIEILPDPCTTGFFSMTFIKAGDDAGEVVGRSLCHRMNRKTAVSDLRQLMLESSSKKYMFDFSLNKHMYLEILDDSRQCVIAPHPFRLSKIVTDVGCDWIGFVPFNIFDKMSYEDMDSYEIIEAHNSMIDFQQTFLQFVIDHRNFKYASLVSSPTYRFGLFKGVRHDVVGLENMYNEFMIAWSCVFNVKVGRCTLEEMIGCHFLHHPVLFFELLTMSTLKGDVYE